MPLERPAARAPDATQAREERERLLAELAELSQDFGFTVEDAATLAVLRRLRVDRQWRHYGSVGFAMLQASFLFATPVVVAAVSGTLDRSPRALLARARRDLGGRNVATDRRLRHRV